MILPETGMANFDPVVRWLAISSSAGLALATSAAGFTFSSGKGSLAEGGVGVGLPVPGATSETAGSAGGAPLGVGIKRYWPSRTESSASSAFQSASALAETL